MACCSSGCCRSVICSQQAFRQLEAGTVFHILCAPPGISCCSQDMLTIHLQSSEALLNQALVAPTMITHIMRPLALIAYFHLHCLSLPPGLVLLRFSF